MLLLSIKICFGWSNILFIVLHYHPHPHPHLIHTFCLKCCYVVTMEYLRVQKSIYILVKRHLSETCTVYLVIPIFWCAITFLLISSWQCKKSAFCDLYWFTALADVYFLVYKHQGYLFNSKMYIHIGLKYISG